MIWDCFNFSNELELLKLRCEELKPLNVQHVLVESPWTYQGTPKPLGFEQHKQDFSGYRIRHLIFDAPPLTIPRKNEHRQRDYATPLDMMDNDTILICDVDDSFAENPPVGCVSRDGMIPCRMRAGISHGWEDWREYSLSGIHWSKSNQAERAPSIG